MRTPWAWEMCPGGLVAPWTTWQPIDRQMQVTSFLCASMGIQFNFGICETVGKRSLMLIFVRDISGYEVCIFTIVDASAIALINLWITKKVCSHQVVTLSNLRQTNSWECKINYHLQHCRWTLNYMLSLLRDLTSDVHFCIAFDVLLFLLFTVIEVCENDKPTE